MATPLSAAAVLAALRAEGVTVVEVGEWRTHNRNHKGAWGPVYGSIVHHTVTSGTADTVRICRDGYTSLPGPLCHGMIAKSGQVHMVGWGRANHAGGGDPVVLDQVKNESYNIRPAPPVFGNADGVDGNAHFYGWECENLGDGKDPWPAAQYDAIVRVQAALCRAHGWTYRSVIGHLEWSKDKVDPRGFTMPDLRTDVAERLKHPASWSPGSTPAPSEEDDMTPDQAAQLKSVYERLSVAPWAYKNDKLEQRDTYAILRNADANASKALAGLVTLAAKVDALSPELTPAQLEALAAQVSTSPTLAETIAEKVAEKLAARLAD